MSGPLGGGLTHTVHVYNIKLTRNSVKWIDFHQTKSTGSGSGNLEFIKVLDLLLGA